MSLKKIKQDLREKSSSAKKAASMRFFKTGPGEYGEGDLFLGVTVPDQRKIAKAYSNLSLDEVRELLYSPYHEFRLTALFILTYQYEKNHHQKAQIAKFYMAHKAQVNNWDLVDASAYKILGDYFYERDRSPLFDFIQHPNLWVNRIAVVATLFFIKKEDFSDALLIIEQSLKHPHDLIHKANGWMLREIGKKNENVLIQFLEKHVKTMPRTTLRYAIERLSPAQKSHFMQR
jgi:3-methyladenine DNA glycosylase AlkD